MKTRYLKIIQKKSNTKINLNKIELIDIFSISKHRFYFSSIIYEKLINRVIFAHRIIFDDRHIQHKKRLFHFINH